MLRRLSTAVGPTRAWWTRNVALSERLGRTGGVADIPGAEGKDGGLRAYEIESREGGEVVVRSRPSGGRLYVPPDYATSEITGMFRWSVDDVDLARADVNWSLNAMGVTPSPLHGGAVRNASVEVSRARARAPAATLATGGGALVSARAGTAGAAAHASAHSVAAPPAEVDAEGKPVPESPPAGPDPADYASNVLPSTGYHHPTAWLPCRPSPRLSASASARPAVPAARFARLTERAASSIHADTSRGTFLRDASLGGGLNVRIVTDCPLSDRHLGNVMAGPSPLRKGPADLLPSGDGTAIAAGAANDDPAAHFKRVRDWPFHLEVILATGLDLPRPERYGLMGAGADGGKGSSKSPSGKAYAVVDFAKGKAVVGGSASSGEDVARVVQAWFAHVMTREGGLAGPGATAFGAVSYTAADDSADVRPVVVLGADALTTAAGAPIDGVTVAGAGVHVLRADGTVSSALSGETVTVAGTTDPAAAKWAKNDPRALIEADPKAGALRVTGANVSRAAARFVDQVDTRPAAIVLCVADGSKAPLVSQVTVETAADRFLAGPNPAKEGSAMYRGDATGLSLLELPAKAEASAAFAAAVSAAGCPLFVVNAGADPESAAQVIATLARGEVDTSGWTANKTLGVKVPKSLGDIPAKALKVEAKISASEIAKGVKEAIAKLK